MILVAPFILRLHGLSSRPRIQTKRPRLAWDGGRIARLDPAGTHGRTGAAVTSFAGGSQSLSVHAATAVFRVDHQSG